MRRAMFVVTTFVLTGVLVAAQDPKPVVQPPAAQPKVAPVQPGGPPLQSRPLMVTPTRMAQLEEEYETLEASREVKKAYVKAAEVGVRAAEVGLDRNTRLAASKVVSIEDVERAKLEVEVAKVQVEIRVAELKEVEVKVKHAKKRLDDAKAAGVRPAPGVRPVPVDPTPNDTSLRD